MQLLVKGKSPDTETDLTPNTGATGALTNALCPVGLNPLQ
jgi:hypothetical protein